MMENIPPRRNKIPASRIWVASAFLLCAVFIFASVPKAIAQVRNGGLQHISQADNLQRGRRYTALIQHVFDFIQRYYIEDVDPQVIFEGAMTGIFNALDDPNSFFMTEAEMNRMGDTTQGTFGGVGLIITKPVGERADGRPPFVEVVSPIEGTPGWQAGIETGDFIVEIDGEATDRLTMEEVLARLRGTPGANVDLLIQRGERLEFPVTITRAIIEVPTAHHAMIGDIGYLRLLTFTPMTANRAALAIREFQQNNYRGLILDLRNNSGGLLNAAIEVSSLFLDGGVVVRTRSRIPTENRVYNTRRASLVGPEIPIVVLINRGSASAAEIVAGALKDRNRAFLVGERTFGKGSVQQVLPLGTAGFRVTTAHYYTPSNVNIDRVGIPPDRVVRLPDFADTDLEQLNRLINDNRIPPFVRDNPNATPTQVEIFARALEREYQLDVNLLRRLIRNERNRITAPVYDLEYDIQLQEAVNILNGGYFRSLMETARTLRELQEEALSEIDQVLAS